MARGVRGWGGKGEGGGVESVDDVGTLGLNTHCPVVPQVPGLDGPLCAGQISHCGCVCPYLMVRVRGGV